MWLCAMLEYRIDDMLAAIERSNKFYGRRMCLLQVVKAFMQLCSSTVHLATWRNSTRASIELVRQFFGP